MEGGGNGPVNDAASTTAVLSSGESFSRTVVGGRLGVRAVGSGSVVASARRDFFAMPLQRNVKIAPDPLKITVSSVCRISPTMLVGHDAELARQNGEYLRGSGSLLVAR